MTVYGYAWIARGRDDGTGTLQNQWMRFTGAGNDDANILEDIITGTVMQRPGLNGLLEVIRAGDFLVVTSAGPAGTRHPGSPGVDQPARHHWRGFESAGYAGGRPGRGRVRSAGRFGRRRIGGHRTDGKLAREALEHLAGADAHHTADEKGSGRVLGPNRLGSGCIGIAGAASPEG